ncbi:UDP-N-acetylglucosamine 2-epimerase [Syntrophomonas wolfei subsp. wolfei str. Goettingen G311]|uniref:UDP-N-acetylglucosamine 2-epimerase n=2 Tax=Syntrophomonas wolfei TaxID=863 RepID=Q0AZ03_SYNWW|nr:UDP-N-acetylglucosamine 2-epimerase [Syntrophomonas wolfei subsp. wolfei str. Goettingen G311]
MKPKVMTIVGTRPEIIKLSRVIPQLELYTEHVLVHTGQNYDFELNEVFFKEMEIKKPDYFLNAVGNSVADTIANVIAKSDLVMAKEKPDAVLFYGDTNSCLAVISAKRRKIPIFHMEAGNRCFDQRVPEEINRKIVDHLSDINMTLTEHARRYLLQEGIAAETVIKTGSTMKEVLQYYMPKIQSSTVLERLGLKRGKYILVSAHREENIDSDKNFKQLVLTLNSLAQTYKYPVIVSTHPRTRKRMKEQPELLFDEMIHFLKPLGFFDYVNLQMNTFCVVSDSGTITEESSILGFPAVTIREAHERPEGMDEGTLIMCGLKESNVINAIAVVTAQFEAHPQGIQIVKDYDTDNVSQKVVRIILSYIDYVNRTVWYK